MIVNLELNLWSFVHLLRIESSMLTTISHGQMVFKVFVILSIRVMYGTNLIFFVNQQ